MNQKDWIRENGSMRIGDFLKRKQDKMSKDALMFNTLIEMGQLWQPCGIDKTIQEIADEGWETVMDMSPNAGRTCGFNCREYEQLKEPANALLNYLMQIK